MLKKRDLVIYGYGGFGREVLKIIEDQNEIYKSWNFLGFIDDLKKDEKSVIGGVEWFKDKKDVDCVVCVANTIDRKEIIKNLEDFDVRFPNIIDSSVKMSDSVELGKGIVICQNCVLTVDIKIGDFTIINISSVVGHDVVLESFCSLMPGVNINGGCLIMEGTYIGAGSVFKEDLYIGYNSVVGMGSVVIDNFPHSVMVAGVPAVVKKGLEVID